MCVREVMNNGNNKMEVDGFASACCDLLPKNLISMSPGPGTNVTQFWQSWLQQLQGYCIHPVIWFTAFCDLDLWPII